MSDKIDFGPLAPLIGTWQGDKGIDIAPEPDGFEKNPFYETIFIEPVGDVTNAEEQVLISVRYLQVVKRKSNDEIFHDEIGYYLWDVKTDEVMQSLQIPRAVSVFAGGKYENQDDGIEFNFSAKDGDPIWGILQSPFMQQKARTLSFKHQIHVAGDTMRYHEETMVAIYGKEFSHTDENTLSKIKK